MGEPVPSMYEVPGLISNIGNKNKKKRKEEDLISVTLRLTKILKKRIN